MKYTGVDSSLGGGLRSGGRKRRRKGTQGEGLGGEKMEKVLAKIGYSFRAVILEVFQPQETSAKIWRHVCHDKIRGGYYSHLVG